jgi:hypothetical protein
MTTGENSLCKLFYFKNKNFLFIELKEPCDLTLEKVKNSYEQSHKLTEAKKVFTFTDARNFNYSYLPKEVFAYMSDSPYNDYQHNNAILINSLAQRILGNFYLNVFQPKVKTRLFTDKMAAFEWTFKNSGLTYQEDEALCKFISTI